MEDLERWRFQWISFVGQSAERLHIRGWTFSEILQRPLLNFKRDGKRRSAIISFRAITVVDLLWEDFFFFNVFIQMFMLILWVKHAGLFCFVFIPVCVCSDLFSVWVDGCSLQTRWEEKMQSYLMNTALEVVNCDWFWSFHVNSHAFNVKKITQRRT